MSTQDVNDEGPQGDEAAQAYAAELQRGQRWLGFSAPIERQFQIDTSRQRFIYLTVCEVIGLISLWIGIANEKNVIPATVDQVMHGWIALTVFYASTIVAQCWVGARPMSRWWMMDWGAGLNGVLIASGIVLATNSDPVLQASVHGGNVVLVVMWFCILCRLRMRIATAASLLTMAMYVVLAKAPSESQRLIYVSNVEALFFTTIFSLGVAYFLEFRERRTYLRRKLDKLQQDALAQAKERLRKLSMLDALTGLYNRRQFEAEFDIAWSQAVFARQPVGLLMLDVDHFKLYNDTYGHPAGDGCLKLVADVLAQVAKQEGGSAARIGGEEFVVLLPGRSMVDVQRAGQAVCDRVRAAKVPHGASKVAAHVTVSVGGAWAQPSALVNLDKARQAMVSRADAALYEAKDAGRNRVLVREEAKTTVVADAPMHKADDHDGYQALDQAVMQVSTQVASEAEVLHMVSPSGDSLAELSALIKGRFLWLRFNAPLEASYQGGQTGLRRRYLVISGVLGILAYNLYWLVNYQLIADVADWFRPRQLALFALVLANVWLISRASVKPWLRELLYALATCAVALLTTMAYGRSHMPSAYAGYITVFVIPLFACVAARQPFWATALTSLATLGGFLCIVNPGTVVEKTMAWDVTMMLLTATNFIFIASYTLERGERMDYLLERMSLRQREALDAAVASLHKLSTTDPLTGISNRRHFDAAFTAATQPSTAPAAAQAMSMLIADVDHFKRYNDGHGHSAGDSCLKRVAQALKDVAEREGFMAARLGGEEFGVLMPGCDAERTERIGHKVCEAVRAAGIPHGFSEVAPCITVSVGVATVVGGTQADARTLLSMADEALYLAKTGGRNRVTACVTARGDGSTQSQWRASAS